MAFCYKDDVSFKIYFDYSYRFTCIYLCVRAQKSTLACVNISVFISPIILFLTLGFAHYVVQPVTRFIQMIQYIIVHPLPLPPFCSVHVLKKRRLKHAFARKSILMKHFPFIHLYFWVSFIG